MNPRFLALFICFLGRQQARLTPMRRDLLFASFADACFPPDEEFMRRFPEFDRWKEKSPDWWKKGATELEGMAERGLHFLLWGDADFPIQLSQLRDPPWALSLKGDPKSLHQPGLSVVGAREPLPESIRWMEEHLASLLKCLPLNIVSGGARGVDQAAHRVALRAERPTLILLPAGISSLYPADLKDWLMPVCEAGGAFVSEFHPRTPMRKWNFEIRNRLIAGLTPLTLVIEGQIKSGTWVTARLALEEGRTLGCLPGSPWERALSGNLELLASGAAFVRDAQDLVMLLSSATRAEKNSGLGVGDQSLQLH